MLLAPRTAAHVRFEPHPDLPCAIGAHEPSYSAAERLFSRALVAALAVVPIATTVRTLPTLTHQRG